MNAYAKEALKIAILQHNEKTAEKILNRGISPNVTDEEGSPYFHLAVRCGYTEIVDLLLSYGADPNHMDRFGNTPLNIAISNLNVELVRLLLEFGANAGGRAIGKRESLLSIILNNNPLRRSHLGIIKILIQYGVTPDIAEDVDIGWSFRDYLFEEEDWYNTSSSKEYEPSLSKIIEENIYADDPKLNDEELLELLELLLQCGFGKNTDLFDLFASALFFDTNSINCGCGPRCTSILLKHGVTPNMANENGTTAFMYSAQFLYFSDIADLLFEKEPNLFLKDKNDKTTLMYAAEGANMEIALKLLQRGVPVNAVDGLGKTALIYLLQSDFYDEDCDGSIQFLNVLLKNGADPLTKDKEQKTALMYAVEHNYKKTEEILKNKIKII